MVGYVLVVSVCVCVPVHVCVRVVGWTWGRSPVRTPASVEGTGVGGVGGSWRLGGDEGV